MEPVSLTILSVGTVLRGIGQARANQDQAAAERQNASFYREQANFAQKAGDRQRGIFDRESQILYSEQQSGFAKAGVDTGSSSYFMAQQMLYRQDESYAIKEETDFNVRLAMLRADQADATARSLSDPMNNIMQIGGGVLSTLGQSGLLDKGGGGGSGKSGGSSSGGSAGGSYKSAQNIA